MLRGSSPHWLSPVPQKWGPEVVWVRRSLLTSSGVLISGTLTQATCLSPSSVLSTLPCHLSETAAWYVLVMVRKQPRSPQSFLSRLRTQSSYLYICVFSLQSGFYFLWITCCQKCFPCCLCLLYVSSVKLGTVEWPPLGFLPPSPVQVNVHMCVGLLAGSLCVSVPV